VSPRKTEGPPVGYPQGPQTLVFSDLKEDDWWALLHALEVRIRYFQQQKAGYQRLDDPGMQGHIDHCDDTLDRLNRLLATARQQLRFPPAQRS
jgi:hypothetical protein